MEDGGSFHLRRRGLSQLRLRRLAALCRDSGPFEALPEGWLRALPTDAPLSTSGAWNRLLAKLTPEDWPDGVDHTPALRAAIEILAKGPDAAAEIGEAFLRLAEPVAVYQTALYNVAQRFSQIEALQAAAAGEADTSSLAASPRH